MRVFLRYFLRGILVIVPLAATVWILVNVFLWIDGLIELPMEDAVWRIPGTSFELHHGLGFLFTVVIVTLVGLLSSSFLLRWVARAIDDVFTRLPVVKLIYTSVKDVIEALVSEQKKFDKPVLLSLGTDADVEVIGFVTRETMEVFGRAEKVAVYVPQSYNFAANLILVPAARVTPVDQPSADVMTFVVSGGVSGLPQRAADRGD